MVSATVGELVSHRPELDSYRSGVFLSPGKTHSGWGLVRIDDPVGLHAVSLTDGVSVGSGMDADVRIAADSIAGQHAHFSVRPDGVYVEDLSTAVGTRVDGVKAGTMGLAQGTLVRLGDVLCVFVERELQSYAGELTQMAGMVFGPRQRAWVQEAIRFAEQRTSFFIDGGPSVGKSCLASLALEHALGGKDAVVVDASDDDAGQRVRDGLGGTAGVWLVKHIDRLDRTLQVELVRALKRLPEPLLVASLGKSYEAGQADGSLAVPLVAFMDGHRIAVPNLASRREDIPAIARALCEREKLPTERLTVDLLEELARGGWPGGVSDMAEALRSVLLSDAEGPIRALRTMGRGMGASTALVPLPLPVCDADLARSRLVGSLDRAGGTVAEAARQIHLSRQAFYREAKRLGIDLPRRRRGDG